MSDEQPKQPKWIGKPYMLENVTMRVCDATQTDFAAFTSREYVGWEVYKAPLQGSALCNVDDLKVGDEILVWAVMPATVTAITGTTGEAEDKSHVWRLDFDKDDRHCWVVSTCINKAALARVDLK